jgi:hypothetical protein
MSHPAQPPPPSGPPGGAPPPGGGYPPQQGGYYPPPGYAQEPPKKSHTLRNVLLVILGLTILGFVGCSVLLGSAVNEIDKSIEASEAEDAEPGGPDNPLEIKVGEPFEVSNFKYAAGWSVVNDGLGDVDIKNLKVENNRADKDSALVEIKFLKGNEVLALVDCTSSSITPGQTVTVDCFSTDKLPKQYDKITINDSF